MNRIKLAVVSVVALVLCGFATKGIKDYVAPSRSVTVKMPGPLPAGHVAPSEEFLADYANYKKLDKEVKELQANSGLIEKQRLLQGTIDALNAQIPAGMVWDEATLSFKPRAVPPAPPEPAK